MGRQNTHNGGTVFQCEDNNDDGQVRGECYRNERHKENRDWKTKRGAEEECPPEHRMQKNVPLHAFAWFLSFIRCAAPDLRGNHVDTSPDAAQSIYHARTLYHPYDNISCWWIFSSFDVTVIFAVLYVSGCVVYHPLDIATWVITGRSSVR